MRRLAATLALLVLVAPVRTATAPPAASAVLDAALDAVQVESIRADVHFLASDELEGRETPSRGLRIAARYLRARLQGLGWQPGAGESYFHEYELEHDAVDPDRSYLELEGERGSARLAFGRDYVFASFEVADTQVTGPVVYCGTGSREDLVAAAPAGAWALCTGSDLHPNTRGSFARRAGARGLIVLPDPTAAPEELRARLERIAEQTRRGELHYPEDRAGGRTGREPGARSEAAPFPQLELTRRGAAALARLAGWSSAGEPPAVGARLELSAKERRVLPGDRGRITLENVCGLWPGSDPELAREVIVVSAHYDHEGVIAGEVYNGADDNASGSAGLLALAEALVRYGPLRRSVLLIWVSGEEKGLFGSRAWSDAPTLPVGHAAVANLNIDMIGRNAPDEMYLTPSRRHRDFNGLGELALLHGVAEGFPRFGSADEYYFRSDQAMFARLGIPVLFLFNGEHADYHRPTDTADKVDCEKVGRVVRLVLRMLHALQADELEIGAVRDR